MTFTIELIRVGRIIQARIFQNGKYGNDLLEKSKMTDVESARRECQRILASRFESIEPVHITYVDRIDSPIK